MEFTPHGFCLAWEPGLLWLTVMAHALVAFAYFGIPVMLVGAVPRLRAIVPDWLLLLFAVFIFLCGLSHILEILVLWVPAYWTLADEVLATAVASLATLYFLPLGVAQILHRHSRRDD